MVKQSENSHEVTQPKPQIAIKKSKYNRFDDFDQVDQKKKNTWLSDGVVYIGHLPYGFYEEELKGYFTQYGQVLGVKVARSRKTARSKGYAFIQFRYSQVAKIVAQTMHGYMLMNKILVSHTLKPTQKNPFTYHTSKQYKYINWKRIYIHNKNKIKTSQEIWKQVTGLLKNQKQKKEKLQNLGILYHYPGFQGYLDEQMKIK